MTSSPAQPYVTTLDMKLADKLLQGLQKQEFEITTPPHTRFSAKKKGLSCTLYLSGKLVVQGKDLSQFVEFYLEPEILQTFSFNYPLAEQNLAPRIGIDESGKGDFFGPLCVAGVYVNGKEGFELLKSLGVKDSKALSDKTIQVVAKQIQLHFSYHIVKINPLKYNEIYTEFKNLNKLLAWGHATTIEKLVEKTGCRTVVIDQFASEWVVELALKRKKIELDLTQRHRAEEDLAVAAASILARNAFLLGLEQLSQDLNFSLPKGSSHLTIEIGKKILRTWGEEKLKSLCKQHFKTFGMILN